MMGQPHIVFLNIGATGHMNPTLPVVAELKARGCKVTYFVDAHVRAVVEAAGADTRPFRFPSDPKLSGLPFQLDDAAIASLVPQGTPKAEYGTLLDSIVYWTEQMLPGLMEDLRSLTPAPRAVVYDPFLPAGRVAAKVLGIPAIAMFTMPGPGALTKPDTMNAALEAKPWVEKPRRTIAETYDFDILEDGLVMECFSPVENIVTTVDELFAPPSTTTQIERFGNFPFTCVGALMDAKVRRFNNTNVVKQADEAMSKPSHNSDISAPLPMERIQKAKQAGRKVLFISLGTVATSDAFWNTPFGPFASCNELPGKLEEPGHRPLMEWTGKEFCQYVWQACFEAFGDDELFFVVMSLGPKADALEGFPPAPGNFLLRDAVPQLEVLRVCDAFLTHGGANSMHEGLGLGVPLAVVPIFGDQPTNADTVARTGAGVSFRYPLSTLSPDLLRGAVTELAAPESPYRAASQAMERKLRAAGGVQAATDAILKQAARTASILGGC